MGPIELIKELEPFGWLDIVPTLYGATLVSMMVMPTDHSLREQANIYRDLFEQAMGAINKMRELGFEFDGNPSIQISGELVECRLDMEIANGFE